MEDIKSVYDEVDEYEYCDLVRKRQEDDWIIDDGVYLITKIWISAC